MPPASRTTSTLATPKVNKGKMPQSSLAQEAEDTLLNGAPSPERRYAAPQFSDDALFSVSILCLSAWMPQFSSLLGWLTPQKGLEG